MTTNTDDKQLELWLATYGSELATWPNDERKALEKKLAEQPNYVPYIKAKAIDQCLNQYQLFPPKTELIDKCVQEITFNHANTLALMPRQWWQSAIILVGCFIIGMILGLYQPISNDSTWQESSLADTAFAYDEFNDWSDL